MISMTYGPGAKPIVSLGEMNPIDFAGFPPRRSPKRNGREIDGAWRLARRPAYPPLRNAVEGQGQEDRLAVAKCGNGAASH